MTRLRLAMVGQANHETTVSGAIITVGQENKVLGDVLEARAERRAVALVPFVLHEPYARVLLRPTLDDGGGAVRAAVVDNDHGSGQ